MRNADRWEQGPAILAVPPDHEVATTKIREGTEHAENGTGIPSCLEFDTFDFDDAGMKQIVNANRQAAREPVPFPIEPSYP
jgi:hypothetical protein